MLTKLNNSNSCQSNAVIDKKITDLQNEVDTISNNVTALTGDVAQNASDIQDLQNCVASGVFENNVEAQTVQANNGVVTDKIAPNIASDVCIYGGVNTPKVEATDIEATTLTVNEVPFTDTLADINCAKSDASNAVCTANDSLTCAQNVKCELDDYKDANTCCFETALLKADYACIDSIESTSACISCIDNVNAKTDYFVNGNKTYKDSDTFVEPTVKDSSDYYLWKLPKNILGRYQMVGVDENDNIKFTVTIDANNSDTSIIGMKRVAYSADSIEDFKIIAINKTHDQLFFVSKSDIERLYVSGDTWNTKTLPEYEVYPSLSTLPQFDYSITTSQSNHTYFIGDSESNNGGVSVCGNFEANTVFVPDREMDNLYIKDNAYLGYDPDLGAYTSCGRPGGIITYCDNLDWANGCPRTVVRKGVCFDEDQWGNQCSYLTYEAVTHKTIEFTPEETPDTLFDEATLAHYKGRVSDGQDPASYSYPLTHLGDCTCVHGTLETAGDLRVKETLVAEKDLAVHGDLLVDGTVTSTDNVNVNTTGNYIVTRDNNNSPMTSGEFSGLAVNNYDTGKVATITADCAGTWRVSDSATATATTYTDISNYNGQFYDGLSQTVVTGPTDILTNINAIELDDVVYDSGYYHYTGAMWTGPLTVVSGAFDLGDVVTDPDVIAALDALTKYKLVYYNSVTDKQIDNSTNQPLLTRSEESDLKNNDILIWDATNKKAVCMARPTSAQSGYFLSNTTDGSGNTTYSWRLVPDFDHIYPVGSVYQNIMCATDPGTLLGQGTWVQITDKFIVARGVTYTTCGGSATATLAVCHLPSHCHTGPSHCHSITDHKHSGSVGSHCHTGPSHCHETPAHCHTGPSHSHAAGTLSAASCTLTGCLPPITGVNGRCDCPGSGIVGKVAQSNVCANQYNQGGFQCVYCINATHSHSITGSTCAGGTGNTGTAAPTTCAAGTGNTGNATPSFTGGSMCTAVNTGNAGTGNTGNTGSGCAFSIIPPYCAVYTWYRCA